MLEHEEEPPSPSPRRSSSSLLQACEMMDTSPYVSPKGKVSAPFSLSSSLSKSKVMTSSLSREAGGSSGQLRKKGVSSTMKKKGNYVTSTRSNGHYNNSKTKPSKDSQSSLNSVPNLTAEDHSNVDDDDNMGETSSSSLNDQRRLVRTSRNSHHYEHVSPVKPTKKVVSSAVMGNTNTDASDSVDMDTADPTIPAEPRRNSSSSKLKKCGVKNHHYEIRSSSQTTSNSSSDEEEPMAVDSIHDNDEDTDNVHVERMEGVEDHSLKPPLVVLDGANVAYAYATTMAGVTSNNNDGNKPEPDPTGIKVACDYFLQQGLRVLVVLPAPWIQAKPNSNDNNQNNAKMITPQLELLSDLKAKGLLLASPPRDDDDAYAITIARREDRRRQKQQQQSQQQPNASEEEQLQQFAGAYVLSNDIFRNAMNRDPTNQLKEWLTSSSTDSKGPGRISFAFCDMGSMDDHGDGVLDIVPNPRHPLISWMESHR